MESTRSNSEPLRISSFKLNGNAVTVILTDHGIEWNGKARSKTGSIEWADVLCITPIMATSRKPRGPGIVLHYIAKPTVDWQHATVVFSSPDEVSATSWADKLNQLVKEKVPQRPKRLLVFINPTSGKTKGVKIYETKVAPLFKLAGIDTVITVTEKTQHAVDVIKKTDLSQYDGVVSVGGDGTFTECIVGMAANTCTLAGINPDNQDTPLPTINTRLGIIPAGTGQGMVETATGTKGAETATLHIIYGAAFDLDLTTVHCGGQLIYTGCLLFGYGMFGEIIRISENNRQLGRARYPYAMLKICANFHTCVCKCNIEILVAGEDGRSPEWIKRSADDYLNIFHFMQSPSRDDGYTGVFYLYLMHNTSRTKFIKFFTSLMKPGPMTFPPFVEHFEALAYKITPYTGPSATSEGAASSAQAERLPFKVINIDGESFTIDANDINVRVHPKTMKMFGDYLTKCRAEKEEAMEGAASGSVN